MGTAQITLSQPLATIQPHPSPNHFVDLAWVDSYWMDFFGCSAEQFCEARHTQIVETPRLSTPWAFARQGNWLVALPEHWRNAVKNADDVAAIGMQTFRPGALPKDDDLAAFFRHFAINELFGPALVYLHAAPPPLLIDGVTIRPLSVRDTAEVARYAATTAIPWNLAEQATWKKVFGLFVNGQLAASCAMRVWGELLAEIYVDTAPEFRCRGYGKAVTHALLQWIHTSTPYYAESVAELTNIASVKLLSHLGGMPYGYVVMSF